MPVSLQSSTHLWLGVSDLSCPSIDRVHHLLAARANSGSLLRRDRARRSSETGSNQFNRPRVDEAITLPTVLRIVRSGAAVDYRVWGLIVRLFEKGRGLRWMTI